MKWFKRLLLVFALLLAFGALFFGGSYTLLRGTPEFYRPSTLTAAQRELAARNVQDRLIKLQNLAADSRAGEVRAQLAERDSTMSLATTSPSTHPARPTTSPNALTVSVTDEELNAFFSEWFSQPDLRSFYERYVTGPAIILQPNRLILAARANVRNVDTVVSLHFAPKLDERGRLDLNLVSIMGGRLPLPQEPILNPVRDKIDRVLRPHLPAWKASANFDAAGAPNDAAVKASLSAMLIRALNREPVEPVLFLKPLQGQPVAVRIVALSIDGNQLTVTIDPLDAAQRAETLARIREPLEAPSAAAQ